MIPTTDLLMILDPLCSCLRTSGAMRSWRPTRAKSVKPCFKRVFSNPSTATFVAAAIIMRTSRTPEEDDKDGDTVDDDDEEDDERLAAYFAL